MRLGLVLAGVGAHSAACIGVLEELARRQIEPYAVCGMAGGAWPAALFGAGIDAAHMAEAASQIAHMPGRILRPGASSRAMLRGKRTAMLDGTLMQRMIHVQTGGRILALCPGRVIFPLRSAHSGNSVVFSTKTYACAPGTLLTLQASIAFAACAAMAIPPFLSPAEWMGSPLFPMTDVPFAARQLMAMGAQRVLVVLPQPSVSRPYDALELVAADRWGKAACLPMSGVGLLRIPMPANVGALTLSGAADCITSGRVAAERGLDALFEQMGMAFCRVLPFRKRG